MTADALVSRELKSLQQELSASRKDRAAPAAAAAGAAPSSAQETVRETADEGELRDQLGQFARELTSLFNEAEMGISAHPTQSVVGALLVGILIGRLLGRR
jgi:ElaB/YqjD/DUF883 family membrane-anchored ribosome-binding protein